MLDKVLKNAALRIRRAGPRQRTKIIRCLKEAADYRKNFTEHKSAAAWADALIWEAEADTERGVFLVERLPDKTPAAVIELVRDTPEQCTIALLVVKESARLCGVGKQAVALLEKHLRADLALGVAQKNTAAVAFWEALGFEQTGTIGAKNERLITMAKTRATS